MKNIKDIMKMIQLQYKEDLRKEYGVKEIVIFGSFIRGEQNDNSDVDILIEVEKPIRFVRLMQLEKTISDLLGIKVDLVTKKVLKPFIGRERGI